MELAGERYVDAPRKSRALAALYKEVAESRNAFFLDAASFLTDEPAGEAHGPDGMHLTDRDHERLALCIADKLKEMLCAG
jgi:lysophospholipase L1-like esterase